MAITSSFDCSIIIWSVTTGDVLQVFSLTSKVYSAKFSRDGEYVVTAPHSGIATIISTLNTFKEVYVQDEAEPFTDARYSPKGKYILTSCENGCASLWDSNTLDKLFTYNGYHNKTIVSTVFSPDGN